MAVDTLARNVAEYPNLIPELIEKAARLFDRVQRQPTELHRIGDLLGMARADVNVENVGMAVGALRFAWEGARRELNEPAGSISERETLREDRDAFRELAERRCGQVRKLEAERDALLARLHNT